MKNARKRNILKRKENALKNEQNYKFILQFISLAVLDEKRIRDGYEYIKISIQKTFLKDAKNLKKWEKFFEYYEKEWIQIVTPKNFCVYQLVDRTNKSTESLRRTENELIRPSSKTKEFLGIN